MINVKRLVVGDINTNCYIVTDLQTKDSIIIDPGAEFEKINDYIIKNNLHVLGVFLTHGHYDHIGACFSFKQKGIKVYIHELDADKCEDNDLNLSNNFSEIGIQTFVPDVLISEEEQSLKIGSINIKVIHTPGHSEGSITFIIDKYIFSGDTIFKHGYGRIDFYDGSMQKLRNSIRKLQPYLKMGYILCDGHS